MMPQPMIFSVMVFRTVLGFRQLDVHHVAAFDSLGAAHSLIKTHSDHIKGAEVFVESADNVARYQNSALRLYVTRSTNADRISDTDYKNWLRSMTHSHYEDGEDVPPAFNNLFKLI